MSTISSPAFRQRLTNGEVANGHGARIVFSAGTPGRSAAPTASVVRHPLHPPAEMKVRAPGRVPCRAGRAWTERAASLLPACCQPVARRLFHKVSIGVPYGFHRDSIGFGQNSRSPQGGISVVCSSRHRAAPGNWPHAVGCHSNCAALAAPARRGIRFPLELAGSLC